MKKKAEYVYPPPIKGFHAVKFFRKIKTRLSKKMWNMTNEELRDYLRSTPSIDDLLKK